MAVSRTTRVVITTFVAAAAAAAGWFAWQSYVTNPWTRDGRVRVDIVEIAPDVSGPIAQVHVKDNQTVKKGDLLFVIDPERYRYALAQAQANLSGLEQQQQQRQRELERRNLLSSLAITAEAREQAETAAATAATAYDQALAALNVAQLNLDRTEVRSPVNGYVTNLRLNAGDYATAGKPVVAVVNSDSFYVSGYFEETKLRHIHEGNKAAVRLMGFPDEIEGHVESVARAIVDREMIQGAGDLIANVNPTFSWVRLAQRIPVRIALDHVPDTVRLSAGMTATIVVEPGTKVTPSPESTASPAAPPPAPIPIPPPRPHER
ncbi:efflux RND transporter periplasmic adaptor subunit [Microvirga terricola]|uniref:HlyD family secretion protein n=1 Tax=Microvirga terricola TaxID=2719797 RepID=A0ABX0VEL9_9HYPH|nr:HlyD family secretion protein [Microvirga terricola]